MSYYPPPQGGYPPYQGQPPQQPYGQQYPPPQGYPPPQQGYGAPPPGGYQQPPPPGPYGQQPPYGQPPPGQYQQPPPGQYQQPPPGQYQQPPPGQYGYQQPPPGQYPPPSGSPYPPPQQGYQQPPPQQPYGAPTPGQYGAPPPPTPPSLGYVPNQQAPMDLSRDIEALYKAMKGFGTDEKTLINVLAKKDPLQINTIRLGFYQRYSKDLIKYLEKEASGYFEKGLVAIARGPLVADCWALREAMKGAGTKEVVLNEVLVGRSNADINAIKHEYQSLFGRPLEADLKSDLSGGTEQLFLMLVSARRNEDSVLVAPQQIDQDVQQLQNALGGSMITKDNMQVCQLLTSRNNAQLQAICQAYHRRYSKSLESVIKSRFTGHMEDVLLLLLARANNRALADAEGLEAAMAGMGTKDELLVQRVVRCHWDRNHLANMKREYHTKFRRDLVSRIKGETSGDYERLMVACVE